MARMAEHASACCAVSANLVRMLHHTVEMATAQRTQPRAVVGAPRRTAWPLKSALRHSVSVAPRTINFLQLLLVIFSL